MKMKGASTSPCRIPRLVRNSMVIPSGVTTSFGVSVESKDGFDDEGRDSVGC